MKVLFITLLDKGGMVHYISQLSNHLVEYINVDLVIPKDCDIEYFNKNINIKTVKTPLKDKWINKNHISIFKLIKIIEDSKPDIIHISGSYIWVIGLFFFFKIRKYKIVITLHDINAHYGENTFINKLTNYFYINIADHIFVHGKKLKEELLNKGFNKEMVSVVPHGDYSFFTKYNKKNVREDGSILFFGRIEDYKGLKYLLKAVPQIEQKIDNFNLIIAGEGSLNKYNQLLEENSNIEIINTYIPDGLVAELFQRASVVVLPYVEGSQSGIIPIAYSFNKPVVVTNVGSIPEVVDNGITGLIVPPKDVQALEEAILTILNNNDLRKQMGKEANKKMKEELSWNNISKKTLGIYKKIIEDSHASN